MIDCKTLEEELPSLGFTVLRSLQMIKNIIQTRLQFWPIKIDIQLEKSFTSLAIVVFDLLQDVCK
jgi:hypothetical protein